MHIWNKYGNKYSPTIGCIRCRNALSSSEGSGNSVMEVAMFSGQCVVWPVRGLPMNRTAICGQWEHNLVSYLILKSTKQAL